MPPNTKKCCSRCIGIPGKKAGRCIHLDCPCHTPSLDKSEHDGTCRTPECYLARGNKVFDGNTGEQIREYAKPTPAVEKCNCLHSHLACQYNNPPCHTPEKEYKGLRHSPTCHCGNQIGSSTACEYVVVVEDATPHPAVEDWEEKLKVMILSRGMGVSLNDCVNYVRSLLKSDRKRCVEGLQGMMRSDDKWSKRHQEQVLWTDIGYNQAISDAIHFITNLK